MIAPQTLGALASIHEMLIQLIEDLPAAEVNKRFHSDLPGMGWLLGRAVYLETHLLRGVIAGEDDLSNRVRHLFTHNTQSTPDQDKALPPKDHLLNWALEIQDENLARMANPATLPAHPMLQNGWLGDYLLQRHGQVYEQMLAVLHARALYHTDTSYQVQDRLVAKLPLNDSARVEQGHYRIGAREGVVMDNEQPVQMVELNAFRINCLPVSNAEYLAFIDDQGYQEKKWWDENGQAWLKRTRASAPWHWRQDAQQQWYGVGIKGPHDLLPDDAVSGISAHEALAYANWAASTIDALSGAVLPHEFQWETAARHEPIKGYGRVWEWCSNTLQPYDNYEAPSDPELTTAQEAYGSTALRGGCLHTQRSLRRSSYRHFADADARHLFTGLRLVLPPGKAEWE